MNWLDAAQGYIGTLNEAEAAYGIPHNLLARIAYQESHFRPDIISGATVSPAGCVGIMQLNPRYFPEAGYNPNVDIRLAAEYLAELYERFSDWTVAVAAYNDGPGNVSMVLKGERVLPLETRNYVTDVCGDVPTAGAFNVLNA